MFGQVKRFMVRTSAVEGHVHFNPDLSAALQAFKKLKVPKKRTGMQ